VKPFSEQDFFFFFLTGNHLSDAALTII